MGVLSRDYTLRHDDIILPASDTHALTEVTIEIEPATEWRDISYTLSAIH